MRNALKLLFLTSFSLVCKPFNFIRASNTEGFNMVVKSKFKCDRKRLLLCKKLNLTKIWAGIKFIANMLSWAFTQNPAHFQL